MPDVGEAKVSESDSEVKIEQSRWVLTVAKSSGQLTICDRAGRVLVEGIYPHPGRKFNMTDDRMYPKMKSWRATTLTQVIGSEIKVTQHGSVLQLSVSGTYPRPLVNEGNKKQKKSENPADAELEKENEKARNEEKKDESFIGGYQAEIGSNGTIAISYDYVPTNATGQLLEAGLSIVLPADLTEFRWIGQGIYDGYPGRDKLNEFGIFHLNCEDLRFAGNRRETELALLTTSSGSGVALVTTNPADVCVEREGDKTMLSHNALISSPGNKLWPPETVVDAAKTPKISGSFTLIPLDEVWPDALTRWFGKPAPATNVFRPYIHSYDR